MKRIFKRSLCAMLASAAVMVGTFSANAEGNVELPFVPYTPIEESKRPYDDKIPADLYAEMEKAEPGQLIGSARTPVVVYFELPYWIPDIVNYMRVCVLDDSLVRRGAEIPWQQLYCYGFHYFSNGEKYPDIRVPGGRNFYENKVYGPDPDDYEPATPDRGFAAAALTAEQIEKLAALDDVICFGYGDSFETWRTNVADIYYYPMHFTSEDALTLLRGETVHSDLFSTGDIDGDGVTTSNDALLALRTSVGLEEIDFAIYSKPGVDDDIIIDDPVVPPESEYFIPGENETPILKV